MDGAPMPPAPTGPHDWFLFVLFVVGILFVFGWFFVIERIDHREKRLQDKQEVLADALAREREEFENLRIQTLINQSPGGRKPWQ